MWAREELQPRKFVQDELQRTVALQAAKHAQALSAAVRYRFIARAEASGTPPLALMLRGGGGRGGATRLKLYLSLLWLARSRSEDPVFAYPARQLAALLGLPKPNEAGARRVQEALRWLHNAGFVALEHRRGETTRVHLLDDAGSGKPYRAPGPLAKQKPGRSQRQREQHFYVRLDKAFWTEGWVSELSGAATAMYLVALHEQRGQEGETIWISPRVGRELYDLADDTRNRGLRELVDYGLLDLERRPIAQASFDERYRTRNAYRIPPEAFSRRTTGITRDRRTQLDDLFTSGARSADAGWHPE